MADHVITTNWSGCDHVLPLSPEHYLKVCRAKELLMAGLAIEESYDVLLLNYTTFETATLSATVKTVVSHPSDRHEWEELRRDLDRHLVNLLASGEMYIAHAERLFKTASRRSWDVAQQPFIETRALLETELVGFQAMKWLRNAALHQALPISSWGFNSSWTHGKTGPNARLQHSYAAAFDIEILTTDRDFPPSLRDALRARADVKGLVQWRPLVREYIEGTSKLNEAVRKALNVGETAASMMLQELVTRYREPFGGGSPASVIAARRDSDGKWLDSTPIDFDYADRIDALRRRNRAFNNLRDLEIVS